MKRLSSTNLVGLIVVIFGAFLALYNVNVAGPAWFMSMCLYFVGCMMLFKRGK